MANWGFNRFRIGQAQRIDDLDDERPDVGMVIESAPSLQT
jgi:hypothetical protein